ncbi:hypothetical protein RQM59_06540 [Flavobacteriaceae bacterium S356]|uniref:Histidine kinase n=1 Tax=Asprobacillus argus TaxID=3076534 RepID=A0ABU3LE89_9FLAO|nr:hypothetical protein [Flavobacteriaceae bacterium S356]
MKKTISITQKSISIICALILFVAVFNWPIEYYTLLRFIVFTGAVLTMVFNYKLVFVLVTFCFIAILFNPIFPMYLYIKSYWIPLDILVGIMFLLIGFFEINTQRENEETIQTNKGKSFKRDKIY